MFGHRPDGELVRSKNGFYKIIPQLMKSRVDSQNFCEFDVDVEILDEFIQEQYKETGIVYSYLNILQAAMIRTIYLRPDLNRFVMNRRIYQRDGIYYSMAIQKTLRGNEESNESTLKVRYRGHEDLKTTKDMLDEAVKEAKFGKSGTESFSEMLSKIPTFVYDIAVGLIKFFDKHGLLPGSVIDASPFHTSFFITDLRSIKGPSIYHHVYEFGTTGLFLSTGPEQLRPVYDKDKNVVFKRVLPMKFVSDERFCDGYYFVRSLNMYQKMLKNPKVLLKQLDEPPLTKLDKKILKKKVKLEKKKAKQNKETKCE